MKKIAGWVIFALGGLSTFACFGAACFLFIASLFGSGEAQAGGQAFGFVCAIIGIPFYFMARFGWRLNHKALPQTPHQTLAQALGLVGTDNRVRQTHDPTETVLAVIDVHGYKTLFFTQKRVIVVNIEESVPGWSIPLLIFLPNSAYWSGSKKGRVKKLPPEEILMEDSLNYAIAYSEILSVKIFKKFWGRKIRIIAEHTTITPKSLSYDKRMTLGGRNYQFEFWLNQPWQWKKYASTLQPVLQDKLEVS